MADNKSQVVFTIETDENKIPEKISWQGEGGSGESDAVMLSVWDKNADETMRIDLWTKEMQVDKMKLFTFQTMLTTADAMARATGDDQAAQELRSFAKKWGLEQKIIRTGEQ